MTSPPSVISAKSHLVAIYRVPDKKRLGGESFWCPPCLRGSPWVDSRLYKSTIVPPRIIFREYLRTKTSPKTIKMASNRPTGFGLSRELAEKNAAKYSQDDEVRIRIL